jgi:hypothetical protein
LSKAVVPRPSSALQLLSSAVKNAEESGIRKSAQTQEEMGSEPRVRRKTPTSKSRIEGPPWIRSALVSTLLIETPWSRNSCYSACSAWASSKWAGGVTAWRSPCSGCVGAEYGPDTNQ